jgi:hypothetical protein
MDSERLAVDGEVLLVEFGGRRGTIYLNGMMLVQYQIMET